MIFRTPAICLLICLPQFFWAQTPVFRSKAARELGNKHLKAIFQDRLGWIWMGGENGLFRYDGLNYQAVPLPDSLSDDLVTSIYESDGQLWVGFESGAICIMPPKTVFSPIEPLDGHNNKRNIQSPLIRWTPDEGTPTKSISGFSRSPDGNFWIATYGEGLYCWKNNRLYQFDTTDGLVSTDIYAITCDGKGRIWAATDAGISICSMAQSGKKSVRNLTKADGLPDEIVYALTTDRSGDVWIGMYDQGICRYRVDSNRFDFTAGRWTYGPVTSLVSYGSREIWAGTTNNGVIRVETYGTPGSAVRFNLLPEAHFLRHERIQALLKDREGLLWTIDNRGGVYSANVSLSLLSTPFQNIQSVLVDQKNRIWAGSAEGLFLYEGGRFSPVLARHENVIALWQAPDGNIWAGTFGNGVFILNQEGKPLRHLTEQDGLINNNVLSVTGSGDEVWLATLGGVTRFNTRTGTHTSFQSELGAGYFYTVLIDSKGRTWFGTDGEGLAKMENGKFEFIRQAAGHALKNVCRIVEAPDGKIWFSTDKDGLYSFDGLQFQRFDTQNHLHSLNISGLAFDGNGYLLVAYEDGLDIVTPATGHVAFFDATSGAPNAEASFNALCRDNRGNVWLGAREGILRIAAFDEPFVYDPEPNITAISIFMQPVDFWENTSFAHDENYFVFNFAGLWYTNPDLVRYRYRLEGSDPHWVFSKEHFASYPNLPPGHYTFHLQASEHGEFEGTPEVQYSFTIKPPFWIQWWFIALCILLASALLYAFIRMREKRMYRETAFRREAVESQFAALKSQINPHFLFNSFNTLITIIEENPKLAVEYVEHFSDFYRTIMMYREKNLITLGEEMDLVRNFDFLLQKRYEDNFRLNCQVNGHSGFVMPMSVQMLVENAVKHNVISRARPLIIDVFLENGEYVVVRNNKQRKMNPEPGTHFGLQSLIHRYKLLGTKPVLVEETEVFFTVKIPLMQQT